MDFGFDSAYANCNAWDDDGITVQLRYMNRKNF